MENLFCRCVTCFETNWMNNFNFFEYLLLMSLRVENYKLVIRQYLYWLLDQLNEDCDCFNCKYCIILKTIKAELWKNNFGTFNKIIEWWRISETSTTLTVLPEIDESWVWEFFFFFAQNSINRTLETANMLLLSKEVTDKDRSLKTQLLVTSNHSQEKNTYRKIHCSISINLFCRL